MATKEAINQVYDARAAAFHSARSAHGFDNEVAEDLGLVVSPEEGMRQFYEAREVARTLLPEVYRHHLDSLSDEEIAERSGRSLAQIKAEGGREHAIDELVAGKPQDYYRYKT